MTLRNGGKGMFEYRAYMNLCNGEQEEQWINIKEENYDDTVTAVFVDALTGGGLEHPTMKGEAGTCIVISPKEDVSRYMSVYRSSHWWCMPAFGTNLNDIAKETQLLMLEYEEGMFCAVVPVVNENYRCVFRGENEQSFVAELSSYYDYMHACKGLAFVYAKGTNPIKLVKLCVHRALKILNNGVRHIGERRYPELMEYLGWCSWDSMQIRVSEEGLLEKCEEFKEKEIPVKWAILDDMWAEVRDFYGRTYADTKEMLQLMNRSALYHYEADPIRFPNGLGKCIEKMKEYGLEIGMWLPTTGYWRGIDPEGTAYQELKDWLIQSADGCFVPDWHSKNSYMYYKKIFDFFQRSGASFVKIDKQSMYKMHYKNLAPIGQVVREYHDGLEAAVGEYFDNCMINCMGMGSEDMWSRAVSPLSRCSGDFQPENAAWFSRHIMQCAYNSILQGQFYYCDWDMWWTDDSQGPKNSLMRAISGGPIYVSDKIGRSCKELLEPLVLNDGRILRCDRPAVPTADCITRNPVKELCALKIQNMAGEHGIMAVLNIHEDNVPLKAVVSGNMIDGFEADEYAVYDYFEKGITILKGDEKFEIELKNGDEYKLYIFAPIRNGFAAIGRTDKFIAPKTIQYVHGEDVVLVEEGPYAYVKDGKLRLVD